MSRLLESFERIVANRSDTGWSVPIEHFLIGLTTNQVGNSLSDQQLVPLLFPKGAQWHFGER